MTQLVKHEKAQRPEFRSLNSACGKDGWGVMSIFSPSVVEVEGVELGAL